MFDTSVMRHGPRNLLLSVYTPSLKVNCYVNVNLIVDIDADLQVCMLILISSVLTESVILILNCGKSDIYIYIVISSLGA